MMQNRCVDLAPLEVVYTSDPTFEACMADAEVVAANARFKVYSAALEECIASASPSGVGRCCFARVTGSTRAKGGLEEMCDEECERRAGRVKHFAPRSGGCNPEIVSPPRRVHSRGHTAAVVEIFSRCQRGSDESASCSALPTFLEREYCKVSCEVEMTKFNGSLTLCVHLAKDGAQIACNLEEPLLRQECETRCRVLAK